MQGPRERIRVERMIAVVREDSAEAAREVARALIDAGVGIIEITFTTPDAPSIIRELSVFSGTTIAAGTVRSRDEVAHAVDAGAEIIVSPHLSASVVDETLRRGKIAIAGVATPSEIIAAHEAGAHFVKLYPARHLGGPQFVRDIRQAIRNIEMIAGGPVGLDDIHPYLDAGCVAVNLGGALAPRSFVADEDWGGVRATAERARAHVAEWSRTR